MRKITVLALLTLLHSYRTIFHELWVRNITVCCPLCVTVNADLKCFVLFFLSIQLKDYAVSDMLALIM